MLARLLCLAEKSVVIGADKCIDGGDVIGMLD